jgi:hypothetical protein
MDPASLHHVLRRFEQGDGSVRQSFPVGDDVPAKL